MVTLKEIYEGLKKSYDNNVEYLLPMKDGIIAISADLVKEIYQEYGRTIEDELASDDPYSLGLSGLSEDVEGEILQKLFEDRIRKNDGGVA